MKQQKKSVKPRKSTSKVGKSSKSSSGLQREISSDKCAVCLDAYKDDFNENGELVREWLQCTSESCAQWMHQDCLREDNDIIIHMWRMSKFLLLILFFTLCKCETFIVNNNMQCCNCMQR